MMKEAGDRERIEAIRSVLVSEAFTKGERELLQTQYPQFPLSDFKAALWDAVYRADVENLKLLALGFPEQVDALRKWRQGQLTERFREAGVDL